MNAKQNEKLLRLEKYNNKLQNKSLRVIDYYRKNNQTIILVECLKCKNKIEYYCSNLKTLKHCRICRKQERLKEYNKKNKNKQFKIIDYYTVKGKVKFVTKCVKCGNIKEYYSFNLTPTVKCKNCKKIQRLKDYNKSLEGSSLQVLDTYFVGESRVILLKCLNCGRVFKRHGYTVNKSITCKYCEKNKEETTSPSGK